MPRVIVTKGLKPGEPLQGPPAQKLDVRPVGWWFAKDIERVPVSKLAAFLKVKPFKIIGILLEMRIYVSPNDTVDVDTACTLLRRFGYTAEKEA